MTNNKKPLDYQGGAYVSLIYSATTLCDCNHLYTYIFRLNVGGAVNVNQCTKMLIDFINKYSSLHVTIEMEIKGIYRFSIWWLLMRSSLGVIFQ